jgi:hypothetical protein
MKLLRLSIPLCAIALLVLATTAVAQDTDKDKLIGAEKAFAANPNPGPESAAAAKQYIYEGTVKQLTPMGRVGALPKARIVELSTTPDPSDPDAKTMQTLADLQVQIYGPTALVSYKQTNTDAGHKDAALNTTTRLSCLDTFVKSKGEWYIVGNACSSPEPISKSVWDESTKMIKQLPSDVQKAYH